MKTCTILFFLLFSCLYLSATGTKGQSEGILVISSYSPLRENGTQVIAAFSEKLREGIDERIFVEYMDSESTVDYDKWRLWMQGMLRAYSETPPRLVVILGGEAWETYRDVCSPEQRDIPVVLGMIKKGFIDYRHNSPTYITDGNKVATLATTFSGFKVCGYYYFDYFDENIDFIRRLQPGVTHVAVCYDNRYNYRFLRQIISGMLHKQKEVELSYWLGDHLSTAQLLDSIAVLKESSAVLMAGWETDMNRYQQAYSMLQNEVARNGGVMYEIQDFDFSNPNYLGGYFVSGEDLGHDLAGLVYSVLMGRQVPGSFLQTPSVPRYHINYQTLKRAGIDPGLLPEDTVLHNDELSLFKKHPIEMTILVGLASSLLFIGLALLFFRRRREQHYRTASVKMKHLLESMPEMAVIFDAGLNIVDIVNPRNNVLSGLIRNPLAGRNIADIKKDEPHLDRACRIVEEHVRHTANTGEICNFTFEIKTPLGTFYAESRTVPYEKGLVIDYIRDITKLRKNENELENIRNELSVALEAGSLSAWVYDVEKDLYFLLYGDKLVNNVPKALDIIRMAHPDDRQQLRDFMKSLVSGRYAKQTGVFRFHREGRYGWYETHAIAQRSPRTGLIDRIVGTEKNITTQIEEQNELRESKFKLELALEVSKIFPWDYDVDRDLFICSHEESPLCHCRYDLETFSSRLLHEDYRKKFTGDMLKLIDGSIELVEGVFRIMSVDGHYEWSELTAKAISRNADGRASKIVGTQRYITESVEAENKLKAYIFKSDLAIEASGILQWDYIVGTARFSSPNPASFMYGGMTLDRYLALVYPEDAPRFREKLESLINGNEERMHIQVRVYSEAVGSYRWGDIHGVIFERDAEGKTVSITGLRRDITETKNMTEELIVLHDKAEEANRLKTAFLANMSHEIRTPLNAIVGFSNLIAQTEDPGEVAEYCRIIETNNELLLQLINDILDLSKIEAGQLEFMFSDFSLSEMFHNLEQTYRYRVKEGVALICDLPPADHTINSEKHRLTQVLSNFLSNACKFTFGGSIRMGYRPIEGGYRFFVTDTGKGVDSEHQTEVFERFAKFDAFIQGTGLGLSICKTIVDRLGGAIGMESEPGKGSTFWCTIPNGVLPMVESPETENVPGSPAPEAGGGRSDPAAEKHIILVAEDNDSNYLLLSSILKNKYRLVRALNGEEAVEQHIRISPDLILMDIKMPVMDGLDATRIIRESDSVVPIIALTAHAFDNDRDRAREAGCNDFMTKPVNLKALLEIVRQYIGS